MYVHHIMNYARCLKHLLFGMLFDAVSESCCTVLYRIVVQWCILNAVLYNIGVVQYRTGLLCCANCVAMDSPNMYDIVSWTLCPLMSSLVRALL